MISKISFVFLLVFAFCLTALAQTEEMTSASPIEFQSPAYPMVAVESGLSGKVVVAANVDEKGNVTSVEIYSGPGDVCPGVTRVDVVALRDSAKAAAMRTKFKPAKLNGKPVASTVMLNFEFTPPQRKPKENSTTPVSVDKYTIVGGSISKGALNHQALSTPAPLYPSAARSMRISGLVKVEVLISEDGSVFTARAIEGHPLLKSAARTAACRATFKQTLLEGNPVKVAGVINYNFTP
jgi:TonB family protein